MKIHQLYYTFCKKGLSSERGFQTYSMSLGISEDDKNEIERHCFYVQPEDFSISPISFSFFKLQSGKPCICRTKYNGIDSSGKFGNYFCHVLVWENEELPFYPIQLYNSKIFKDALTEEEENAEEIEPLPILNSIPEEEFIKICDVKEFLKLNENRKGKEHLNELIDSIIESKINNKKVIFADNASNLHMWIAAVTMAFPVSFASNITFNTYNFDAEGNSEFLCGTVDEGFEVSDTEGNYKFNKLNLLRDVTTKFSFKSKFAKQVVLEYTAGKSYKTSFIEFMQLFNYNKVDERIDNYVNLLYIVKDGFAKVNSKDAAGALDFANKYGSQTILEEIMEKLDEEALGNMILNLDLNLLKVVFEFLFRIAKVTRKKDYMDKAYEFFFNAIQFVVTNDEQISIEDILKVYENIRIYNEENIQDFVAKSVENKRLKDAKVYLNDGKSRYALFYMCSILQNFIFLGKKQNSKIPWELIMKVGIFEEITESSLKILIQSQEKLNFLFRTVLEDDDYFSNLVIKSCNMSNSKSKYDIVIAAYNEVLEGVSQYKVSQIVKKVLDKKDGGEFLIFAYKYEMKKIGKRTCYFRNYCLNVFDENPEYRRKYFSLALEELMLSFKAEDFNMEFYRQFTKYIEKRKLEKYIGKFLATRIVKKFQNLVLIKVPNEEEKTIIEEMNFLNNYYSINVSPNISEMMHYAELLSNGSISVEKFLCDEKKFQFGGIDEKKYEKILRLMFQIICPRLKSTSDHIKMKNVLMYDRFFITYFNIYINTMGDIFTINGIDVENKNSYKLYLDFIYFIIKCKVLFSESQFKDIEKFIFEKLESVDLNHLKSYDKYMQDIIINTAKSEEVKKMRREWQKIYKNLNDNIKKRYILDKLQKIYRHKAKE